MSGGRGGLVRGRGNFPVSFSRISSFPMGFFVLIFLVVVGVGEPLLTRPVASQGIMSS